MDIDFELYKIFYFTARLESFSKASQVLFITQSAVSQSIKNLETKLGQQLFIRDKKSIRLTPEGSILYKHIEQAFNFIKAGESKLSELKDLQSGEIRIGVGDTICKYFLIPSLERFNQKYPQIKIQIVNRTSSQILQILKNGLLDLGIVTLPVHEKGISVMDFIEVEDIFVASQKFSALKNKTLSLKALSEYPLLMLPGVSSTRRNLENFLKESKIHITPEIELESVDLLVEFAKIGIGISHVLMESAKASMESGDLFPVQTLEKLPKRRLGIATMSHVPLSNATTQFVEFLKTR